MSQPYTYWHNALMGQFGPIHENDPQCGYYRMRWRRGGEWIPVAIFREDDGEVLALCKGEMKDAFEVWTWCCRYPVDYEVYRAVAEEGKPWPEDSFIGGLADPAAMGPYPTTVNPSPAPLPTIGHNSSGVTEAEGLLEEIDALNYLSSNWLDEIGTVSSQSDADRAANYAEAGLAALEAFEAGEWGRKYPAITGAWRRNWDRVIPFFAFPKAVRKIIYTTNAIEALNSSLRRAVKIRGHFPTDEAALKLIFLVLRDVTKEWKMSAREWTEAKSQFAILFGERFKIV